jgi:hypothetical protein
MRMANAMSKNAVSRRRETAERVIEKAFYTYSKDIRRCAGAAKLEGEVKVRVKRI